MAPSRIPRSALLCSLSILSLATFAHATVPTALGTATLLDETEKIVRIVGGILVIISSIYGFVRFVVPWLRGKVRAFKSDLILEAVKQADVQCEVVLCDLREMIEEGRKSKRTWAGTAEEQKQSAAVMEETLVSLQKALARVAMGMEWRRPTETMEQQRSRAQKAREGVLSFLGL